MLLFDQSDGPRRAGTGSSPALPTPNTMPTTPVSQSRPTVSGKFFRLGEAKFYLKGVTYGPFRPGPDGRQFLARPRRRGIWRWPANWAPTCCASITCRRAGSWIWRELGLKLLIDIPWSKHLCFLDSPAVQDEACAAVRAAVQSCARHPAVFAYSVVNELPPDIVRWSGAAAVENFLDELAAGGQGRRPRMPLHLRQLSADGVFEPAEHRFPLLQRLSAPAAALRELPGPPANDRRRQAAGPGRNWD